MTKSKIFRISFLTVCISCCLLFNVEAREVRYNFYVEYLSKSEKIHGQVVRSNYCENKINVTELGIKDYTVDDEDIYVSPNEQFFVFRGAIGRHAPPQWFLADTKECKVIKKLVIDDPNVAPDYDAAFSPDSKKLFVSWDISTLDGPTIILTKEFSGDGFKNERVLKNIVISSTIRTKDTWVYEYRFSPDGKYLLASDSMIDIYRISEDEKITSFKTENFISFEGKKYYGKENEYVPYIANELLLYSFDVSAGTEMNIFDYTSKTLKKKIVIPLKGIGIFSSNGSRIIFSTFPDTTWKKEVIVCDTNTGSKIGKTTLDEIDEIVDVSSDDKQLIYKRDSVEMRIDLQSP